MLEFEVVGCKHQSASPYLQMHRTRDDKQARPNGNRAWARGFLTGMRNLVNERAGGSNRVLLVIGRS